MMSVQNASLAREIPDLDVHYRIANGIYAEFIEKF